MTRCDTSLRSQLYLGDMLFESSRRRRDGAAGGSKDRSPSEFDAGAASL